MEKPEHIKRMEVEAADLEDRINKLLAFLHGPIAREHLNRTQTHLLNIQADAMGAYLRVLKVRIEHDTELAETAALIAKESDDANTAES